MKTVHILRLGAALGLAAGILSPASAAPVIQNVQPPPGTVSALTQVTVTFSATVTNIVGNDLLVNGLPADTVSGVGAVHTFTLASQPAYGAVEISWDAGHNITDLAQPPNRFDENGAGATWQYNLIDITPPTVALLAPVQGVSVRSMTQIEVSLSEAVAGVDAGDLLINDSPASGLSVLGVGKYRFTFPQPASGTVQVRWATSHDIRDFASAPNSFAGGSWSYVLDPNLGLPSIRINEFLAANLSGLADEDLPAEPQDWIEIWNYGASTVNLNGYSLTDDPDDPGKWTFPSTNLAAGEFLVVFASEKNRRTITNAAHRFHTNFKLNPRGEYLALFNAESPRVVITEFAPEYPEQRNNSSYGYDTADALKYFITPTPGAANGSSAVAGVLAPPHFNVDRGLFDQPFTLILSSSETGAMIRYTTDGTEPTEAASLVYSGPLLITNTTVLRAAAFRANTLPSVTVTHTYLFLEQIVQQPNRPAGFPTNWGPNTGFPGGVVPADYEMDMDPLRVDPNNPNSPIDAVKLQRLKDGLRELPTVSIVMKTDDIFGTAGLYQRSAVEATTKPSNKKPCSVEMILPDGSTAFATTCGIDLHGNASRNPIKNPKHGFKLKFRGDFGPPSLNYRLFEDSPVEEFDDLILRADFGSSWRHWSDVSTEGLGAFQRTRAVRTRDAWFKDTMRDMGGLASHNRFFHLYLNGLYWGTYEFSEQPTETFAKTALGGSDTDFDIFDQGTLQAGTATAYNAMLALPAATTLVQYEQYQQVLNLPEFTDYMLMHFFIGHQDWSTAVTKNWYAIRKRVPGAEGTFRYIPWDGENLLLNEDVNRVTVTTPPSGLHTKLDDSPEYRLFFADRVHRSMIAPGGALTPAANIARWYKWQAVMDKPIVAESVRWGDYRRDVHPYQNGVYQIYTRENHWLAENARIMGYFTNRNATVLGQLRAVNMYPNVSAPTFNQQGGFVARGFNLTMTASNAIYYTLDGTDPRVYGTSEVSLNAATYAGPITLNNSAVVKARARFGTNWSALNETTFTVDALGSPLRITEIMYNPIGGDGYEFIELQNVRPTVVNVGLYSIDGLNFAFAPGTLLQPGQVIVLGSLNSPANWNARYPGATAFARFDGRLDNGGEKLAIRDAAGKLLWSVDYDDENGWPTAADGQGYSIEIIDVFGDPDDPANWRASAAANGTPGSITPPPGQGAVVINEVMAENGLVIPNGSFYPDWVELHNPGAQSVDLAGWSLTDDSNPRKFVFPANTTIAAGGYVVVWCDTNSAVQGLRAHFRLGRNGDAVLLYDANTNRADAIGFGIQLPTHTIGRIAGAWQLNQPTPNAANVAAATAGTDSLVINEWLPNALPGGDDWVELYNRSATAPVALHGIYLGVSNALQQLNALSFIAPGGYVQLFADENGGANNLDFTLPAAGGTILLYSESGTELDRVTYGAQAQGVSRGRLPDGTASITSFPATPSPEASNYLLSYSGPILNEVLAINQSAATNASGRSVDFVELQNTNTAPFELTGMRLSNDPENSSQWTFPAGVSIPGNGYIVVWFDNEQPASTVNGSTLNTGQSLDGESDEVWLFNSAGQPVDSVVFGFQIADLPIGLSGGQWTLLSSATPDAANAAPSALASAVGLRINEWSASPADGNDWFEIHNTAMQPVSLTGLYLADNPSLSGLTQFSLAPLSYIGAKGFVRCIADADQSQGRNHVNFNLDGEGEVLRIASQALGVIDTVSFGVQAPSVSQGRLPDGAMSLADFPDSPTPAESNYLPIPNAVLNEMLTHTDAPLEDAVEIHNPTAAPAAIGGWYLSDSQGDFKKYRIADGTTVPAYGFRVLYQNQFDGGAGSMTPFTLDSSRGNEMWLSAADGDGNLTGHRTGVKFGAAANGVPLGRYATSVGVDFTGLSQRTFGADNPATVAEFRAGGGLTNAYPLVGPVVLNELMYHPPDLAGTNDNTADEFIELYNLTSTPVPLFDPAAATNTWQLRSGVSFNFPPGVTLAARGFLLVVSFDPASNHTALAAFRSAYGLPASVPIHGPYSGKLDNGGESIELRRPDALDQGFVPYLLVDRVDYDDVFPWPVEADGGGPSLQRRRPHSYGNDLVNWQAGAPTAGRANVAGGTYADADGDGISDAWESANGLNPGNAADAALDADGDGHSNYEEFLDGTNPQSAASALNAPFVTLQPQSQTTLPGSNLTFAVTAGGTAPFKYQWHHNGKPIAGGNNSTLALTGVESPDAGAYTVVLWNGAGFAVSQSATLTVNLPPNILLHPVSQVVATNTTVTFTVAAAGTGPIRYQWQFNGVNLPNQTSDTLVVMNTRLDHEGDYRVLVTDDITTVPSAVARLTVKVGPVILVPPLNSTNAVGATVTFNVTASGSVPMWFQWRKGSAPQTNMMLMTTNASWTLRNVQLTDTATYRVVITNSGSTGAGVSGPFFLQVLAPPAFSDVAMLTNGDVRMLLSGTTNRNYAIEVSSNLTQWSALRTLAYSNGLMPFIDTNALGTPHRFYRARQEQ